MRLWFTMLGVSMALPATAGAEVRDVFYGRMRGDMVLSIDANASVLARSNRGVEAGFSVVGRARFMDMMGIALGYDRSLSADRWDALWLSTDLRPTYASRVNFDQQHGPRWLDLMVDSIGLEFGVGWIRPGASVERGAGFGYVLGTGIEFPLYWEHGTALMLRLAGRFTTSSPWDAQGAGTEDEHVWQGSLGLVFRGITHTGLIGVH